MATIKKIIFSLGLSIFIFSSCKDNILEKKVRLNPNDIQFDRLLFRVRSVPSQSYVEIKKKITFHWEKTSEGIAANPEVWVYRDNKVISKANIVDFSLQNGEFELDLMALSLKHMEKLQVAIKQSNNGIVWLDTLSEAVVVYDETQAPVLSYLNAIITTSKSIKLQSEIIKLGTNTVNEIGICMNMSGSPTTVDKTEVFNVTYADGVKLDATFGGLVANTSYYFRLYAKKGLSTIYGKEHVFRTALPNKPSIGISTVSSVTSTSCSLSASISDDGGGSVSEKGFVFNTNGSPNLSDNKVISGNSGNVFSAALEGLSPSKKYYVAAYATNSAGTTIGTTTNFSTPAESLVSKNNCDNLSGFTAKFEFWSGVAYSWADWTISSGYLGNGLFADNGNKPALGGYVEFTQNFSSPGFLRFWINTPNPGYNNRIPTIYVDGVAQLSPTMVGGQASSFYWEQLQTDRISKGNHKVKIEWGRSGMYFYYKLDEIEVYQ
jgi:hypothetical protein